jgi:hypothetical protein
LTKHTGDEPLLMKDAVEKYFKMVYSEESTKTSLKQLNYLATKASNGSPTKGVP